MGCLLGVLLANTGAFAQTSDAPSASDASVAPAAPDAHALFLEGREAMAKYDYERACALFRNSQHEQPAVGTLLNLGLCEEKLGHYVAAIAHYRAVRTKLPSDDGRHIAAAGRLTYLESRIPHLTIRLEEQAPEGTRVLRNGVPLSHEQLGKRLAVDPGEYEIIVSAPGREDRRIKVRAEEEEDRTVVASLGPVPSEVVAVDEAPDSSWQKPLGYTLGILGAASIVTAGVTGGLAFSKADSVRENCPPPDRICKDDASHAEAQTGSALTTAAFVTAAVGVVGLGAGAYLLWSSDEEETPGAVSVTVSATAAPLPGGGGVFVLGNF